MTVINNLLPVNEKPRKWVAIGVPAVISGLLAIFSIYGAREYGFALFYLTPLFTGAAAAFLYGYKRRITRKAALWVGLLSLSLFTVLLVIFAIEGVICIAMAAPLGIVFNLVGSLTGYGIVKRTAPGNTILLLLLMCSIPSLSFIEKNYPPPLTSVTTSIEINASPETVWKNVIKFPQLPEPTAFIFKTGIAYPINATIEGEGVGAARHCNFNTGSFVEPITVWDKPRLLRFDVAEQPVPMKEVSFWDVNAPHLHDYFVSKQGQFRLIPLPNGNTLLEGTTWYYHNIKPVFYWRQWSTFIIHKIHLRVLEHIKEQSEK